MSQRDSPITERPYMPGYGIEPAAAGLLPWSWAEQRLRDARHVFVATRDAGGAPHVAAVWSVWLDGALHFSTAGGSRKARDLAAEPRCAVTPGDGAESVVLEGVARRITDAAAVAAIRAAYLAKYGEGFPDPDENPLFAVEPVKAFGMAEARFTTSATRWRFVPVR
jgi:Pyridoxamine 5'-phosphate oxidase